jgi:hypothetical protein
MKKINYGYLLIVLLSFLKIEATYGRGWRSVLLRLWQYPLLKISWWRRVLFVVLKKILQCNVLIYKKI